MITRLRTHLTYSNIMATVAVFVALGGGAYAAATINGKLLKNRSVAGRKLKKNTVTGKEIKEATLGIVPHAKKADSAASATNAANAANAANATNAGHAGSADTATTAGHATSADSASTASTLVAPEDFHLVGTAGGPVFQHSWNNRGGPGDTPAGFYKDQEGIVHLEGRIVGGSSNNVIFQLPAGYRPPSGKFIMVTAACECTSTTTNAISIAGSGLAATAVGGVTFVNGTLSGGGSVWLDGISFRAGS